MQSKNLSNPSSNPVADDSNSDLPRCHDSYSGARCVHLHQNAEHQMAASPGLSSLFDQFELCGARESRSSGKLISFPLLIWHTCLRLGCAGRNGDQCQPAAVASGHVDAVGPASHGRPLFSSEPENHADASGCAWKVDKFVSYKRILDRRESGRIVGPERMSMKRCRVAVCRWACAFLVLRFSFIGEASQVSAFETVRCHQTANRQRQTANREP
jgi:hypothetical protein